MGRMLTKKYGCYRFGSATELTDQQLEQFIKLFNEPVNPVDSVLGGRASVQIDQIPGFGSVVIKHYTRGGLIRHLVKQRYVKWGKTRCQIEYDILNKMKDLGVGAPKPVVYAYQGRLFYRCWLVTREIEQQQTLARLSLMDVERASSVIDQIAGHIATLIQNQILHVDLHPGNVLVDSDNRVYLIDFDKARYSYLNKDKLRDKYISRWRRAVIKHRLPEMLWEIMDSKLRNIC